MMSATQSNNTERDDPTLASLLPQPSPVRNLLLAIAGVVILAGIVISPGVLRPSVIPSDPSSGSWQPLGPHPYVLIEFDIRGDGWRSVSLQSVGDVPGATVAAAWVTPIDGDDHSTDNEPRPESFADVWAYLDTVVGTIEKPLPQAIDDGEQMMLTVLWEITNCSLLHGDDHPEVQLKTMLGTSVHEPTTDGFVTRMNPGSFPESLADSGICP